MTSMMGVSGLGGKPIKVSIAVQKTKMEDNSMDIPAHLVQHVAQSVIGGNSSSHHQPHQQPPEQHQGGGGGGGGEYGSEYYNQYNQYWSQYAAWQQYQQQYAAWEQQQQSSAQPTTAPPPPGPPPPEKTKPADPCSPFEGPLTQLVEHKKNVDMSNENTEWLEKSEELWKSVEESGWWYLGQE